MSSSNPWRAPAGPSSSTRTADISAVWDLVFRALPELCALQPGEIDHEGTWHLGMLRTADPGQTAYEFSGIHRSIARALEALRPFSPAIERLGIRAVAVHLLPPVDEPHSDA